MTVLSNSEWVFIGACLTALVVALIILAQGPTVLLMKQHTYQDTQDYRSKRKQELEKQRRVIDKMVQRFWKIGLWMQIPLVLAWFFINPIKIRFLSTILLIGLGGMIVGLSIMIFRLE